MSDPDQRSSSEDRISDHLRSLVASAREGDQLPSVRQLMSDLHVSPSTVRQAIRALTREGLIDARPGLGTFVAARVPPPSVTQLAWQSLALGAGRNIATDAMEDFGSVPSPGAIVFNAGYLPPELQPLSLLQKATLKALKQTGVWGRMPIEGTDDLRLWFSRETGGVFVPHDIIVCAGTQSALSAAFRALATPGDAVLMESPTYAGAVAAARAAGLRPTPVPIDADGVVPAQLDEAFQITGAKVFYSQPCYANPTGASLSDSRRAEVLDIVQKHGAFLIEDDWARDFHFDPSPAPRILATDDQRGHVVYIRSLTKVSAPGIRVGAICARGPALARLRQARLIDDFFVPGLLQETTVQLVCSGQWPKHLRMLQKALKERRDLMVSAISDRFGQDWLEIVPNGGLHLWLRLPPGCSEQRVQQRASALGVLVSPGKHWFPAEPTGAFLRLSFAAAAPDTIARGVGKIANAIEAG